MDPYKETFETWDKVAKLYQDKFMDLKLYDETYDFFCNHITTKNPAVLEIGCGPGNITRYMLNKRPDFIIEALDISQNMIELAKINNPEAKFIAMDSRHIGKLETKYNAIICGFCLPYLSASDCSQLIQDFKNLLIGEGLIYISFVEGDYNKSGYQAGSSGDRTYFYYHPADQINNCLKENNFELRKTFHIKYIKSDRSEEIHTAFVAQQIY